MADGYILSGSDAEKLRDMYRKTRSMRLGDRPQLVRQTLPSGPTYRHFELTQDTSEVSSTSNRCFTATLQVWDSTASTPAWVTSSSTDDAVYVYDEFNEYHSYSGAVGLCRKMPNSCHWEICRMQRAAQRCKGLLTAALNTTDASFTVDNVAPTDQGLSPVDSSTETLTVYNRRNTSGGGGYEGVNNEVIYFERNTNSKRFEAYDMGCKSAT